MFFKHKNFVSQKVLKGLILATPTREGEWCSVDGGAIHSDLFVCQEDSVVQIHYTLDPLLLRYGENGGKNTFKRNSNILGTVCSLLGQDAR